MFETLEMVRLADLPVIVMKRELADIPLFGWVTRRYGVIPVEREAGAKALRAMLAEGKEAVGDRAPGDHLSGRNAGAASARRRRSGRALPALYRALGLPVVPVAVDSGRLWGRGPGPAQRDGHVQGRRDDSRRA